MTERALITGAAGFVGRHMANYLHDQGLVVHGLDRPGIPVPADLHIAWHTCDITDAAQIAAVVGQVQPDYVFHLAALIKSESLVDLLAVNVLGTLNVLDALVAARPEALLLVAGSSAECGLVRPDELPVKEDHPLRPLSPYSISKVSQSLLAAQYAYLHDLNVIRTRTFNLTGPGEPEALVCSAFAKQIVEVENELRPPILEVGNLDAGRDFVDVRDAIRAYWLVARHGESGQVYNVCSGSMILIRKVLETLIDLAGIQVQVRQIPERYTKWDVPDQIGDPTKLRNLTNWVPTIPFHVSLKDLLGDWRNRLAVG